MDRIIRSHEPSLPYTWTAILTGAKDLTGGLGISGASSLLKNALSGDLSSMALSFAGEFGRDTLRSQLAQSVQLPSSGFTVDYSDFGFIRYPVLSQINTEPITIDWLETSDNAISKYFLAWQNEMSPVVVNAGVGIMSAYGRAMAVDSVFAPLDTVARTLFIIKTRRDATLSALSYLVEQLQSGDSSFLGRLQSGTYELPVQIFCYPKVVPIKTTEAKLDKSETNSVRTFQTVLERVPTLVIAKDGFGFEMTATNQAQLFLSAVMGYATAVTAISDTVLGGVTLGLQAAQRTTAKAKIFSKSDAAQLTDLSKQT